MKILVCEDHPMCREAMVMALRQVSPEAQIDQVGSIAEADEALAQNAPYDLVLTDLVLPDSNGLQSVLYFSSQLPNARIAVASGSTNTGMAAKARSAGAIGFVPKAAPMDEIVDAIRRLVEGEETFPAEDFEIDERIVRFRELTPGQMKIVLAAASGRLNKQIAFDHGLTEATVKAHLAAAFKKLGVINRVQATLLVQSLSVDSTDVA